MSEEYWFDQDAADKAVAFFPKYCRHTEGEWAGRPFVLAPWQEDDIIRPFFGWKRADGTRRYRRCIIWVPRKNGKTELMAGVSLLALVGDGELGGQGFSIATDKDQAKLVFNKALTMVGFSEDLSEHLECYKTSVYCPQLNASFKPLSGKPTGKHGLSASFIGGDEVHEWVDDRLYTFVHQSTAARRQPIEFLISTAGVRQGYGWELWEYCERVREGIIDDPETLIVVYAADPDDDWSDEAVWRKANPNLGVSPKLEYLKAEYAAAAESPRKENDFKRYHLNVWTEQAVRWINIGIWDRSSAATKHFKVDDGVWDELAGRECYGGLDLSTSIDLTALAWVFPPNDDSDIWDVLLRFWVPEDNVADRVKKDRVPYDQWIKSGFIKTTEGNVIDYRAVKNAVFEDCERFKVKGLGYDPWNATQTATELHGEGVPMEKFRQGYGSLSEPSKEFERLVLGGLIEHHRDPVLRWMVKNVAVATDPAGNIKPDKAKSTERIDGVVASIMGIGLATKAEQQRPSVYKKRGALVM